jgi:phosphoribosylglycinamide formyltransferase-1
MKIGILISGRGSNMVALVDAVNSGEIPNSEVAVVISDKPDAPGLERARERGVETVVIERRGRTREEHDTDIVAELEKRNVELVCLAGYMRLLSKGFIRSFDNRIVNIHPSLLPAFPGLDAQRQAIDYGVKISGCTVHFVDEGLDSGAIILQRAVEVKDDDTAESLSARILEQEHSAYVESVTRIASGRLKIRGRRTSYAGVTKDDLLQILLIGHNTSGRGKGLSLKDAIQCTRYTELRPHFKELDFLPILNEKKEIIEQWIAYSEDKRTDGGFWITDKPLQIGNLKTGEIIRWPGSIETAVAHYVLRELDFWSELGRDQQ